VGRLLLTVRTTKVIFDFEPVYRERLAEVVESEMEEIEAREVAEREEETHAYYDSDAASSARDGDEQPLYAAEEQGYEEDNERMRNRQEL
jgi:hypothetical protein